MPLRSPFFTTWLKFRSFFFPPLACPPCDRGPVFFFCGMNPLGHWGAQWILFAPGAVMSSFVPFAACCRSGRFFAFALPPLPPSFNHIFLPESGSTNITLYSFLSGLRWPFPVIPAAAQAILFPPQSKRPFFFFLFTLMFSALQQALFFNPFAPPFFARTGPTFIVYPGSSFCSYRFPARTVFTFIPPPPPGRTAPTLPCRFFCSVEPRKGLNFLSRCWRSPLPKTSAFSEGPFTFFFSRHSSPPHAEGVERETTSFPPRPPPYPPFPSFLNSPPRRTQVSPLFPQTVSSHAQGCHFIFNPLRSLSLPGTRDPLLGSTPVKPIKGPRKKRTKLLCSPLFTWLFSLF